MLQQLDLLLDPSFVRSVEIVTLVVVIEGKVRGESWTTGAHKRSVFLRGCVGDGCEWLCLLLSMGNDGG